MPKQVSPWRRLVRSPHFGQGSNSANVRRYNERLLLQALRRAGQASKADLARLFGSL